jgi:hypothetical protein
MEDYKTRDGCVEVVDGQYLLIHPTGPDELFDSFEELAEAYPVCERYRDELFGEGVNDG